jgi:hypothetical protein
MPAVNYDNYKQGSAGYTYKPTVLTGNELRMRDFYGKLCTLGLPWHIINKFYHGGRLPQIAATRLSDLIPKAIKDRDNDFASIQRALDVAQKQLHDIIADGHMNDKTPQWVMKNLNKKIQRASYAANNTMYTQRTYKAVMAAIKKHGDLSW